MFFEDGSFTPRDAPLKTPQTLGTDTKATMRAEIEHLVDETKQSVGLLRRHL
jgi:hypothetical protein